MSAAHRRAGLSAGIVGGAGLLIAYRDLWRSGLHAIASQPLAQLLAIPGRDTVLLGILCGAVIAWRRRHALCSLSDSRGSDAGALIGCGAALVILVWARVFQTPDILPLSLAALLMAFSAFRGGRSGLSATLFPAFVIALAVPIP